MALRVQLMIRLRERLQEKGYTQVEAAKRSGHDPAASVGAAEGHMEGLQHGYVADACDSCRPQAGAAPRSVNSPLSGSFDFLWKLLH